MKEIILKSVAAIFIVALILTVGAIAPQEVRNVLGFIGISLVIGYIFLTKKKDKEKPY